jgi:transposase
MHKADGLRSRKDAMDTSFLGIDIAKAKFDVALRRPDGSYRTKVCPNTPAGHADLLAWLRRHAPGPVHACLEATGTYGDGVATALVDAALVVSLVNPAAVEAFGRSRLTRTKTDPTDARLIADFCATHRPPAWQPLPIEVRTLQAFVRRLDALEGMRQQERNRLAAEPPEAAVRGSIQHVIDMLEDEMTTLKERIRDHFDQHPGLRQQRDLLTSIPGIGEATAAILLAEFGLLSRFASAKACAAFSGIVPRERRSGSSVRGKTVLSKLGSSALRKALFFPALAALRHNPIAMALRDRLRAAGKHKMVIVGAVMRKLIHLAYGVLKTGQPFRPDFAHTR